VNYSYRSFKPERRRARRDAGFTLIELMMVLVIVAVILTIVLPGFDTLSQRTRLKSYANEFVTSVVLARGEAIKRNTRMDLCVVLDPDDPVSCGTSGNWEEGWLVKDPNSPDIVRYQQALNSGLQLFDISSASFSTLSFDSRGLGSSSRRFKLCKPDGIEVKQISISTTGRTRIETCPSPACDCDATACGASLCDG
jgi:type IV fimbrial biogenesis protein FimT